MRELRPYQKQAIEAVFAAEQRGVRCQALVLATGLGKTVIFSHLIAQRGGRALVLAHRDELLQQAALKILAIQPGANVGIVRGDLDQRNAQIVVASVQTLARDKRLQRLRPDFSTVIVDECHHAAAKSYEKIFEHVAESNPLLVGVTATPDRADGKGLDAYFSEIVFEMGIDAGIEQGWLANLEGRLIHLKGADFSKVHVKKGDYDLSELEAIMDAANWHEHVAGAYFQHAAERKGIIFVPKVSMARDLAAHMAAQGARVESVDGTMATEQRRGVLRRLATGETQVVVNCAVLTEGFDEPSISCVVMARPTKSRALYVQCVGRGLRLHAGKENCLVLDMVGVSQRHDLVTMASLAGVGQMRDGETFLRAKARAKQEQQEAEEEAQKEAEEKARLEAELEARRVQLLGWSKKPVSRERHFAWQFDLDGSRTLAIGEITITVRPMAGGFWMASDKARFREIRSTAEECQRVAEQHASTLFFSDRNAPWRARPATAKQINKLRQWRIQFRDGITAGEASDLMSEFINRQKRAKVA